MEHTTDRIYNAIKRKIGNYLIKSLWYKEYLIRRVHRRQVRIFRIQQRELENAKILCRERSLANNRKMMYVLPDDKGDLKILSRKEIEALKRHKVMSKKVDGFVLRDEAVYHYPE